MAMITRALIAGACALSAMRMPLPSAHGGWVASVADAYGACGTSTIGNYFDGSTDATDFT
jgi:acyl-coenzyme A thioesterase PaaI-like protein